MDGQIDRQRKSLNSAVGNRQCAQKLRLVVSLVYAVGVASDQHGDGSTVRHTMHSYWRQHSKEASVEEMMLDSKAEELGKEEIPETMSMLPDTTGMDVLELGAGIG